MSVANLSHSTPLKTIDFFLSPSNFFLPITRRLGVGGFKNTFCKLFDTTYFDHVYQELYFVPSSYWNSVWVELMQVFLSLFL